MSHRAPVAAPGADRSLFLNALMNMLKKIARYYLLSLDATIRLLGSYIIIALMLWTLKMALNSLNWLFCGSFATGPLHLWIGLLVLPPLLRLGLLAGGFSIPPLLKRSKDGVQMLAK